MQPYLQSVTIKNVLKFSILAHGPESDPYTPTGSVLSALPFPT